MRKEMEETADRILKEGDAMDEYIDKAIMDLLWNIDQRYSSRFESDWDIVSDGIAVYVYKRLSEFVPVEWR